jgi:hypothetical protein
MKIGAGLVRDSDGILVWQGGRHYTAPDEAVKTWWGGETKITCAHEVSSHYSNAPCGKGAKYDPDKNGNPTRCGHHSAAALAKKDAARRERNSAWEAKFYRKISVAGATAALEPALRKIAAGHNDAMGLAQEVIAALDAARDGKREGRE